MRAQPIPPAWIQLVTGILELLDPEIIEWSITAEQNWHPFGLEQDAYELLMKTLKRPEILGQQVIGMRDRRDGSYTDCWAFLCDHPWGSSVPLYAKIGVHHSRVYINLFSLHPDDGSAKLQKAIENYRKNHHS